MREPGQMKIKHYFFNLFPRKISSYTPYLLVAPALIYLFTFIGYPLVQAIVLAFQDPSTGSLSLTNFETLFKDAYFWDALKYTFILALIIIPLQTLLALSVALFLNMKFKGANVVLYTFTIPLTISDVAAALIWYNMLTTSGFLNRLLLNLGVIKEPVYFFGYVYRHMELLAIVVTEIWRATAIVFVIIFAGLQLIGRDYLEAAEVCGASVLQRLRYIVLPLIKPSIQAALIIRTLFALQVYAVVWILAGRDIPILAGEAYYWMSELYNPHIAATYSLLIAFFSILIGWFYIKLLKPKYEEVLR